MAKQEQKRKRKSTKKKTESTMSIEIVMAILILIQFLAIFKLGFLGRFFANSIRFFVGDLFIYAGILGILASIGVLFRGRIQSIPKKWIGVATSLIIAIFLWVEVASFSSYVQEGGQLFKEMMARYAIDFKANAIEQNLGSGMIGALFYTITYFLVSQWGTYLTIFVLFMISIFVAFEIHLKDVFEVLRNWTAQIQHQLEENKVEKDSRVRETKSEVIETKPKEVKEKKASLIDKMKNFVFDEEEEEDEFEEIYPEVTPPPVTKTVAEEEFVQPKREEPTSFNPFVEPTEVEEDTEDLEDFVINGGTDDSDYQLPPLTLLNPIPPSDQSDEKMIVDSKYNELVLKTQELKKNQLDLLGASKTEERNRIARDLHDSVGHLLSTLSIQLTALEKITKSRDLDISENIGELKNFTQDGLREVRKIIHDMKVEDNNWKNNIEKLINNSGIKINYIVNEETWKLNERQEQAIYRIIQEFITNSQKYANTNKINISLIFSEDSLVLSMRDFGKGCENLEEKGGLLSIRERVNELHGKMNVESGNNKGFYLQVYIPRVI